jgi:hypothetical protein
VADRHEIEGLIKSFGSIKKVGCGEASDRCSLSRNRAARDPQADFEPLRYPDRQETHCSANESRGQGRQRRQTDATIRSPTVDLASLPAAAVLNGVQFVHREQSLDRDLPKLPAQTARKILAGVFAHMKSVPRFRTGLESDCGVGRRDDCNAPRLEDAVYFGQKGFHVGNMLNDLAAGHEVEALVIEWQFQPVEDLKIDAIFRMAPPGLLYCPRGDVDSYGRNRMATELLCSVPVIAAKVQDRLSASERPDLFVRLQMHQVKTMFLK